MDVPLYDAHSSASGKIVIGNDVWIGENVKIRQGVTIGHGAVLAQESFVTDNIPPYAIVGGNPAKVIRYRFSEEQISELLEIAWWNWEDDKIKEIVPHLMSEEIDACINKAKEIMGNK